MTKQTLNTLDIDDQTALRMVAYYPTFNEVIGQKVKNGFKFTHDGQLYKTIQPDDFLFRSSIRPEKALRAYTRRSTRYTPERLRILSPTPEIWHWKTASITPKTGKRTNAHVTPAPPYITHYPSWLASMLRLLRRVSALLFLCPGKAQNSTGKKEVYEDYADCY